MDLIQFSSRLSLFRFLAYNGFGSALSCGIGWFGNGRYRHRNGVWVWSLAWNGLVCTTVWDEKVFTSNDTPSGLFCYIAYH